jgi:hypothetical protein
MLAEERQARQGKQDGVIRARLFAKIASDAATRSHRLLFTALSRWPMEIIR